MNLKHEFELRFRYFESEHNQRKINKIVTPLLYFAPKWIDILWIDMQYENDNSSMASQSHPEYHTAWIKIRPAAFDQSDEDIQRDLLHEIMHFHFHAMLYWVRENIIDPTKERNEELYKVLNREFTKHSENLNCSLTETLLRSTWVIKTNKTGE